MMDEDQAHEVRLAVGQLAMQATDAVVDGDAAEALTDAYRELERVTALLVTAGLDQFIILGIVQALAARAVYGREVAE